MKVSSVSTNNKRIAKNTLMLYFRMFLIMAVGLYTSRIILQALGIEDFGIYNVVGGVVVLFTFVNNAMVASTQRFLNYEIGRNNQEETQKIFSASLSIHIAIAFIFLILAETIGLWFLNTYIKIPNGREIAANWVYQFTIVASIINIIRTPYNAAIIAYERMSFYAYISIIEVILKLLIVYLIYLFADRLIFYSLLVTVVALIIFGGYYLFCRKNFPMFRYQFEYNRQRFFSIISFSGWSLMGSSANMGAQQGFSILLNLFFGVSTNAALGIANQVNSVIYNFISNFQTAFNPQIVKTFAAHEREDFFNLIYNTSRYSFFLLFALALPITICCSDLLHIWLTEVPEYAIDFCIAMIANSLFDALSGPLWMSVYASGNIRKYQIVISCLLFSTLALAYIVAKLGYNPVMVFWIKPLIGFVIYFYRLHYCHRNLHLSFQRYLKSVVVRCLIIVFVSGVPSYIICTFMGDGIGYLLIKMIAVLFIILLCIFFIGLTTNEKKIISKYLKNKREQWS